MVTFPLLTFRDSSILGLPCHHCHVKDSPEFHARYEEIKDYFDQLNAEVILMAHNAPFDLRFLKFELEKAGQSLHPKIKGVIDPLSIFRSHFKNRDPKPQRGDSTPVCFGEGSLSRIPILQTTM